MSSQAQQYFYDLLIGRGLVREAMSDVFEATKYEDDDVDASDGGSWKQSSTCAQIWTLLTENRKELLEWNISAEDIASLTQLLFGAPIQSRKELFAHLGASREGHTGLVFQMLSRYVFKNVQVPDDLFVLFHSSQAKEEMESHLSQGFARLLAVVESAIRAEMQEYRSFSEQITRSPDFLDNQELGKLASTLQELIQKIVYAADQDPQIQTLEKKFTSFWTSLPR